MLLLLLLLPLLLLLLMLTNYVSVRCIVPQTNGICTGARGVPGSTYSSNGVCCPLRFYSPTGYGSSCSACVPGCNRCSPCTKGTKVENANCVVPGGSSAPDGTAGTNCIQTGEGFYFFQGLALPCPFATYASVDDPACKRTRVMTTAFR